MTQLREALETAGREAPAQGGMPPAPDARVAVVMITRDRRENVLASLAHLRALPERPRIVVVDNGSSDGTVAAVRRAFPEVELLALPENRGAAARTEGVRLVATPYVAFADDDSWWAPGALPRAADLLDGHPTLAVLAARVLVGEVNAPDPTCAQMAASPLPRDPRLPGPAVLGFIACGAVVRRSAYLAASGFHRAFGVGGEEELLAIDLAAAGWSLTYADDVIAHHHPSPVRDIVRRRRIVARNALWCAWLRRPPASALAVTAAIGRRAVRDGATRAGIAEAARGLPWVLRQRRRLPEWVEQGVRALERGRSGSLPPPPSPHRGRYFRGQIQPRRDVLGLPSVLRTRRRARRQNTYPCEGTGAGAAHATFNVSVIIPTYRRDDTLLRCLEALARQDYPRDRFEIVVVDDARGESVPRLVTELSARHPGLNVMALPGGGRGPATARNIGWRVARGRVIAFIDDDAYPADEGWLRHGLAPFVDARVVGVSGSVTVPVDEPPTDFQRNVQGLERGEFVTCNAFYRRSALAQVGGFDEAFTMPYREDSDLQYRVEDSGGLLVRAPGARVVHPALPGRFAVSLRLQRYSQFNPLIYRKHPRRYRRLLERRPPYHYYGMIGAALTTVGAALAGRRRPALAALAVWSVLEGRFLQRRLRGTSRHPRHVLDLALTSLLIPWLSVYWRLRGAIRYRVPFW